VEKEINKKLDELEVKHWIYNDHWGPNAPETLEIKKQIHELNMQLLDIMCPDGCLIEF
jgi:hypothetical protein